MRWMRWARTLWWEWRCTRKCWRCNARAASQRVGSADSARSSIRIDGARGRSGSDSQMIRVGYPNTISARFAARFPRGNRADPRVGQNGPRRRDRCVDSRSLCNAGDARVAAAARREAGAVDDGGNGVDSGTVGPHVTICNAHGAHNVSTAEWTLAAILAMLKYFPLYLDIQRSGVWKRRFEASAHYASDYRRHARTIPR
jgi:hypothetical protein